MNSSGTASATLLKEEKYFSPPSYTPPQTRNVWACSEPLAPSPKPDTAGWRWNTQPSRFSTG